MAIVVGEKKMEIKFCSSFCMCCSQWCFELFGFASQVFSSFLTSFWALGREGMYHQEGPVQWHLSQVLLLVVWCWLTQQTIGKDLPLKGKIHREGWNGWDTRKNWQEKVPVLKEEVKSVMNRVGEESKHWVIVLEKMGNEVIERFSARRK